MFKAMFQNENRLIYSSYLLSYLLEISYEELQENLKLIKNELDKKKEYEKGLRSDYVAKIHGIRINIEINNNSDIDAMKRNIEYARQLYSSEIARGKELNDHQVIQINFDNFSFEENEKIIDIYTIQNNEGVYFNNKLIFIHIYFPNLREKYYDKGIERLNELERYLMVLIETNIVYAKRIGKGRKIMEEYIEEAEEAVLGEDLLRSYDKELAYGEEQFREGEEKGKEEGKTQKEREIIRTMLESNFSDEDIMKATKCTKELLDEIKKE